MSEIYLLISSSLNTKPSNTEETEKTIINNCDRFFLSLLWRLANTVEVSSDLTTGS